MVVSSRRSNQCLVEERETEEPQHQHADNSWRYRRDTYTSYWAPYRIWTAFSWYLQLSRTIAVKRASIDEVWVAGGGEGAWRGWGARGTCGGAYAWTCLSPMFGWKFIWKMLDWAKGVTKRCFSLGRGNPKDRANWLIKNPKGVAVFLEFDNEKRIMERQIREGRQIRIPEVTLCRTFTM